MRATVFRITFAATLINVTLMLLTQVQHLVPDSQPAVRIYLIMHLAAQAPVYWLSRRPDPSLGYACHVLLAAIVTYVLCGASAVPFRFIIGPVVFYQMLLLFVALLLLRPPWFLPMALLIAGVDIASGIVVLRDGAGTYHAGVAMACIIGSTIMWLLTSLTSLVIASLRQRIDTSRAILLANNERLEEELKNRTRTIEEQQRQIFHAAKMQALGTLAGGVAHDFNNLLMGIRGNVELLHSKELCARCAPELDSISRCVDSGATLSKQLLGFARRGKYNPREVELASLVRNAVDLFRRAHKGQDIVEHYGSPGPWVLADAVQLEQVVLNLLANATQAMPNGGTTTVEVSGPDSHLGSTADTPPPQQQQCKEPRACLTISDTGLGMDDATRQRIFEPFFTTKEVNAGTGLGLASAYGIVKNHGGTIDVQSQPNHGTTFRISLPAIAAVGCPAGTSACTANPSGGGPSHSEAGLTNPAPPQPDELALGSGQIVLVIDDEQAVLNVLASMLECLGYRVRTAADAQKGLEIYHAEPDSIDLVILDILMPGIDGVELFHRLRQHNKDVRIVIISGFSRETHASGLLSAGALGFLAKPFTFEALASAVRNALATERG